MSPGHGASLSTTAGITSVITGVMAAILAGQAPPAGAADGAIACAAIGALALGAGGLYLARNAVCQAMDAQAAGLEGAGVFAARALMTYHLGMAGVFTGLALAASWRLALPHGVLGWAGAAVAGVLAVRALAEALAWAGESPSSGPAGHLLPHRGEGSSSRVRPEESLSGPQPNERLSSPQPEVVTPLPGGGEGPPQAGVRGAPGDPPNAPSPVPAGQPLPHRGEAS
ncbi:MAG: hypothetical protein ACLGIN_12890 [Candidatus Sericytochromatia bacterium]